MNSVRFKHRKLWLPSDYIEYGWTKEEWDAERLNGRRILQKRWWYRGERWTFWGALCSAANFNEEYSLHTNNKAANTLIWGTYKDLIDEILNWPMCHYWFWNIKEETTQESIIKVSREAELRSGMRI